MKNNKIYREMAETMAEYFSGMDSAEEIQCNIYAVESGFDWMDEISAEYMHARTRLIFSAECMTEQFLDLTPEEFCNLDFLADWTKCMIEADRQTQDAIRFCQAEPQELQSREEILEYAEKCTWDTVKEAQENAKGLLQAYRNAEAEREAYLSGEPWHYKLEWTLDDLNKIAEYMRGNIEIYYFPEEKDEETGELVQADEECAPEKARYVQIRTEGLDAQGYQGKYENDAWEFVAILEKYIPGESYFQDRDFPVRWITYKLH